MKKKPENFTKNIKMGQNWFSGVLKPAEHELGNEKFLRCKIEEVQLAKLFFSENRPVDSQFCIVGFFRCQIRVQQASKPLRTNFGPFIYCWEDFRVFFFQTDRYTLKGSPEDFFAQKIVRHTEKAIFHKFQLSKCYTNETGPKSKKGETKK